MIPNYWKVRPIKIKPIKLHFNFDTDRDGVRDRFDCRPFDFWRQDDDYDLFKKQLQENLKDIIKVVNGYGIYKDKYLDGSMLYYAVDMNTGLHVLNNYPSLKEIEKTIRSGEIEKIKQRMPEMFDIKGAYELEKRYHKKVEKYGNKSKRFSIGKGKRVLDVGAGDSPDIRATHAIDLQKPYEKHSDIDYKYGYDFNKESTNLPYPSNYFDVVISYGAYGRNFISRKIANEMYRVLKPRGRFETNAGTDNESIPLLQEAGFQDLHYENYYDEYLGKNIKILVAKK